MTNEIKWAQGKLNAKQLVFGQSRTVTSFCFEVCVCSPTNFPNDEVTREIFGEKLTTSKDDGLFNMFERRQLFISDGMFTYVLGWKVIIIKKGAPFFII